jgi:hypothetical protein
MTMTAVRLLDTIRTRIVGSEAKKRCTLLALSLSALLSACGEPPAPPPKGQFPFSVEHVYERLQSKLPDFVRDRQCGILIHVSIDMEKNRYVIWHVKSSGKLMLSFKATLTPVDAGTTQVDIAVSPGANGGEAYDGTQFYPRPAVLQPVRPAIEEQISALIEGRPYEMSRGKIVHKNGTFSSSPGKDTVCLVQRGGLQSGHVFTIHD